MTKNSTMKKVSLRGDGCEVADLFPFVLVEEGNFEHLFKIRRFDKEDAVGGRIGGNGLFPELFGGIVLCQSNPGSDGSNSINGSRYRKRPKQESGDSVAHGTRQAAFHHLGS